MHVISRKRLLEFGIRHPDAVSPLDAWYRLAKVARWRSFVELREQIPSADLVGRLIVFNIKGNSYRLIAEVFFDAGVVLLRAVLTHADYDRGGWKR